MRFALDSFRKWIESNPREQEDYPKIKAVKEGNLALVKQFIDNGFFVNQKIMSTHSQPITFTLLHVALVRHQFEIAKFLVESGAKPAELKDQCDNKIPFSHIALSSGNLDIISFLTSKFNLTFITKYVNNENRMGYQEYNYPDELFNDFNPDILDFAIDHSPEFDIERDKTSSPNDGIFGFNLFTVACYLSRESSFQGMKYLIEKHGYDINFTGNVTILDTMMFALYTPLCFSSFHDVDSELLYQKAKFLFDNGYKYYQNDIEKWQKVFKDKPEATKILAFLEDQTPIQENRPEPSMINVLCHSCLII